MTRSDIRCYTTLATSLRRVPQAAALNAVVADASTHVIRGTTVSVQWSRGAKDGGSDRPRRRNSGTSGNSGGSPSRGGNRSSPKMSNFSSSQKGGHRGGGGGGGGGGSNCGSGCSPGYSPHRSRSQGHLLASGSTVPYGYCGGPGTDHLNQPMVSSSTCHECFPTSRRLGCSPSAPNVARLDHRQDPTEQSEMWGDSHRLPCCVFFREAHSVSSPEVPV